MKIFLIGDDKHLPYLIRTIIRKGHDVSVIHKDRNYCKELSRKFSIGIINGDGTNPTVLEDAGIELADIVIGMNSTDHENLVICEMAQTIYQVPKTLAIVHDPKNIEVFKQLGVKNVISFTEMISSFIEQKMNLDDITDLYSIDDEQVSVLEVDIKEGYRSIGKNVSSLGLPPDSILSCIIRGNSAIIPKADTKIAVGDRIITYSLIECETDLIAALRG